MRTKLLICLVLAAITIAIYWQVAGFAFVNYDDLDYVPQNFHLAGGLTGDSVKWALTTFYLSTWQPMVWLSYMLDWHIGQFEPAVYHVTNAILHVINVLLLFLILSRMTGSLWRSAFVAALFGVHPLHVESVAWVAERKDVLATLFWFLGTWAYLGYVKRPQFRRYALVFLALALGLMSKPLLVTFPISLLLLDYWPLGRIAASNGPGWRAWWPLVREKIPLFALVAVSGAITYHVQHIGGAVTAFDSLSMPIRVANGLLSYVRYLGKTFWPSDLAVIYPHLGSKFPLTQGLLAGIALAVVSVVVFNIGKRRPYLTVGWLWYLITLLPMIGLIQFGEHAMADRFTYVPLIGIFVIVAWGVPDLLAARRAVRGDARLPAVMACVAIAVLCVLCYIQVGYWSDGQTLFEHAIECTTDNYVAYSGLGYALQLQGMTTQAIEQYQAALKINPGYLEAHANLGGVLLGMGQINAAMSHYLAAAQLEPDDPKSHYNLGLALQAAGKIPESIGEFEKAVGLDPNYVNAWGSLGNAYTSMGQYDRAEPYYRKAMGIDPTNPTVHANIAVIYYYKGEYATAWQEIRLTERYGGTPNPAFVEALSKKMPDPGE